VHFTLEMLRKWKQTAEEQSFRALVEPHPARDQRIAPAASDTADRELIKRLGLAAQGDLESVTSRLISAAQTDLAAFKRIPGWPRHAIALNLRMTDGHNARAFNVTALAAAIETFNEVVVVAPPGTGKTTTLLQVVEAILLQSKSVAAFVPLGEWSSQTDSFFQSIVRRHGFTGAREEHLKLLAHHGRLVLVMDGWNELDAASRKRARDGIRALQREFPSLGIVVSTRRQALDVPISGPVVEIDGLAEGQQLEIARALRGSQGEAILDHAWRTPGVRELVAIPLYLTALLANAPGATLPTTKEEVLRLFVVEHERPPDKAEALRAALFGFHTEILRALAVEATRAANTTISDTRARAVVKRVEDRLFADGQITIPPQPTTVLDVLVSHHALVRSGAGTGALSFQHQQFQEWYASFAVEALMLAAAAGDGEARQKLRVDVLNMPAWEEPILFACERVSRADGTGARAVAAAAYETIAIDPMLSAEMIYRSSADGWDEIKERITGFVGRWHTSGKVDRAVRFMINTGRSEFASRIWPLISHMDSQVHLAALRAGRRFRPSVLGADAQARIAQLAEELREHVVSEIASESGMDGIELATRLARADASPRVQASVIEALHFRRADRFVADILRTAPDEVWQLLARKGYVEEISEPDAAARMRRERQHCIEGEGDPLRKLNMLVDAGRTGAPLGREIGALIEAADFPATDHQKGWIIHEAHKRFPEDVISALVRRLEAGRGIPFQAKGLLRNTGIMVDEGPLVDIVLRPDTLDNLAEAAVSIVGPQTVGRLIDKLVAIDAQLKSSEGHVDEPTRQQYWWLISSISKAGLIAFIQAVLSRPATDEPHEIALLADLLARHGKGDDEGPLQLEGKLYEQMIGTVGRWCEILLASPAASRAQLAEVAQAIQRLAAPQLVPALKRMLAEDLTRWRRAREEFSAAHARGQRVPVPPDVSHSWTLQYRRAFVAIGGGEVVELMKAYLPDSEFGVDAAYVLRAIWDGQHNPPKDKPFISWLEFSEVKARRVERQERGSDSDSSPLSDAIIAVVDDLAKPGATEDAHRHALELAKIAFSMPYGNKRNSIDTLLELPRPLREKRSLLAVLVLAGEIIRADMVLDGIRTLLEEAKTKRWLLDENQGALEGWLELIPFSDRPGATVDALELVEPNLRPPWRLRRLLSALGHAPSPEAEHVLDLLSRKDARFLSDREWLAALDNRGTVSAARILLELVCGGALAKRPGGMETWTLSLKLAGTMRAYGDFRAQVYQRYQRMPAGPGKAILEHAIAEVADADGVLVLVRSHAAEGKPFSGILHSAIRHVAVGERPSADWAGANEVFSVPVPELRKKLFAMTNDDTAETRLAAACLTAIDELREFYGPVDSEPRHPDIDSGRPWPLAAG